MRRLPIWFLCVFVTLAESRANDELPDFLIRLPDSVETVFVVETTSAAFHRFDQVAGQPIAYRGRNYMSIGKGGDGKQRAGDQRTPLGVYFVTEQLDTERMHEKYGVTAFPLDYPNAWDVRMQRSGDGIWVHGVDARVAERPLLDTDGCIALPNDALAALKDSFDPNATPVVITRNVVWTDRATLDELRTALEEAVSTWRDSLERGDMHAYLSLYDDEFRRWGMNKAEWTALQMATVAARPIQEVTVNELLLLGDPAEEGLYLSRFRLAVTEASNTVVTTRRLYWHRSVDGAFTIVAEDAG